MSIEDLQRIADNTVKAANANESSASAEVSKSYQRNYADATPVQLNIDPEAVEAVQVHCKYVDYLKAQAADMERYRVAVSTHLELPPGSVRMSVFLTKRAV